MVVVGLLAWGVVMFYAWNAYLLDQQTLREAREVWELLGGEPVSQPVSLEQWKLDRDFDREHRAIERRSVYPAPGGR
jgi:hypothetical protein